MSRAAYPAPEPLPIGVPPVGRTLGAAGRALRVEITGIPIEGPEDFGRFYAAARASGADAVVMPNIAPFMPYLNLFAAEAAKSRIPTIGFDRRFVEAGGFCRTARSNSNAGRALPRKSTVFCEAPTPAICRSSGPPNSSS